MEFTRFQFNLHEFELFNTVFQQLPNKFYILYFWRKKIIVRDNVSTNEKNEMKHLQYQT